MKNWVKVGVVLFGLATAVVCYKVHRDNVQKKQRIELEHKLFQMEMRDIEYMDSLERSLMQ